MLKKKVSIILPVLNQKAFIKDRVDTIVTQTFTGWECIVIDGFSSDGTWEYLLESASADKRFKLFQRPANGVYDALNFGIIRASGRYIYIAMADDKMMPDCLEKMCGLLDKHPECDACHCKLQIIDAKGDLHEDICWDQFENARYLGDIINKHHIRYAPHDGLWHCSGCTMYTSLTQLLIRKHTFNKVGYFSTDCGSVADFEWGMIVGLLCTIAHLPEYLATWRIHEGQLTSLQIADTYAHFRKLSGLIWRGYKKAKKSDDFIPDISRKNLVYICVIRQLEKAVQIKSCSWMRWKLYIWALWANPNAFYDFFLSRKKMRTISIDEIHRIINRYIATDKPVCTVLEVLDESI